MPGSHSDTYAESFHRSFFADWQESRPTLPHEALMFAERRSRQKLSSSHPDSQLDAIGCLPMILPFVLLSASANEKRAVSAAVEFGEAHPSSPQSARCTARRLSRALKMLDRLGCLSELHPQSREVTMNIYLFAVSSEERLRVHQSAVNHLGLACYTRGALSSMFYLAHQFHDDPRGGILANTNCGGENCNRGAALGALLGAGAAHRGAGRPRRSGRMS
ncbi:uncharacterized protein LOC114431580 [Parambassis ranga]|uniref:Uncharacterized protein LOC114431580 n=1 Tax=Parambassis ranga TaxID=210632 RepID=A0A6P7I2Q0_9TELE|nr:uncharacterized protein LOC114431580 [Parambassis ranga]